MLSDALPHFSRNCRRHNGRLATPSFILEVVHVAVAAIKIAATHYFGDIGVERHMEPRLH